MLPPLNEVHMRRCVLQLQQGIGSDEEDSPDAHGKAFDMSDRRCEEALSRLQGDDKFMQFFGVLQLQDHAREAGSKEEASVERSLKDRRAALSASG
eukprot:2517274-Amphidinium_carterae.1